MHWRIESNRVSDLEKKLTKKNLITFNKSPRTIDIEYVGSDITDEIKIWDEVISIYLIADKEDNKNF
jgi:hypothetical protein